MSLYFGYENPLELIEAKIQENKNLIADNKTDIKTERTRVDTNKSNIATNKTNITLADQAALTAKTNSLANKADIATNKTNITANTTKGTLNGDKLLKKVDLMHAFQFHYTNPTVGIYNDAEETIRGYPGSVYHPFLHRTAQTTIHLEIMVFDQDTTMDSTEKAQFQITFLDSSGNITSWESPLQTISSGRLINTVYEIDIKMEPATNYPNKWDTFRAFKIAYKPVVPTKVNGNESVLRGCVYSK